MDVANTQDEEGDGPRTGGGNGVRGVLDYSSSAGGMTGLCHLRHDDGDASQHEWNESDAPPSRAMRAGATTTVKDRLVVGGHHSKPLGGPRKCGDTRPLRSGGPQRGPVCGGRGGTRPRGGGSGDSHGDNRRGVSLTEWMKNSCGGGGRGRRRRRRRRRRSMSAADEHVSNNGDDYGADDDSRYLREIRRDARLAWTIADAVAGLHEAEAGVGVLGVSRGVICPDNVIVFHGGGAKSDGGGRPDDCGDYCEDEFSVEIVVDPGGGTNFPPGGGDATSVASDLHSLGLMFREVLFAAAGCGGDGGDGDVPRSISAIVSKLMGRGSAPETATATSHGYAGYRSARDVERDLRQMLDFPERFLSPPPSPSPVDIDDGGTAAMTTPAEEDARPRFSPDRIYGLDAEESFLLVECTDLVSPPSPPRSSPPTPGMVLVSGASGTGKSILVGRLRDPAVRMGARFLFGRFEPPTRQVADGGEPFSALASALGGYFEDLLASAEPGDGGDDMMSRVVEACGGPEGASVLIGLIPHLGRVIGPDLVPPVPSVEVIGADGHGYEGVSLARRRDRRLRHLLPALFMAIASRRPLVLVLDDLQWADEASLDVVRAVVAADGGGRSGGRSVLFIGCLRDGDRDGDVLDHHRGGERDKGPISVLPRDWEAWNGAPITRIQLGGISGDAVNHMVSDALGAPRSSTRPLTDIVHSVTGGNPILVVRYVWSLCDGGLLRYSHASASWVWSVEEILSRGGRGDAGRDTSQELLVANALLGISPEERGALELAACLGPHCNEETLRLIADEDHPRTGNGDVNTVGRTNEYLITMLDSAVRHGLVAKTGTRYQYGHEQVRRAAYNRIPESERGALHMRIGWRIWKRSSPDELERLLLVAAEQLHLGLAFIERRNKIDASMFFLRAGKKAMSMSLFLPASTYLKAGIDLLDGSHWDDHYELNLELYDAGAEIEYCNGNFDRMGGMIDVILAHARTFEERLSAYSTLLNALGAHDKVREAIETGFCVLEGLGEQFPSEDVAASLHSREWMTTRDMLDGFTDETLVTMGVMEDARKIAAMKFLNMILLYTYIVKKEYLPLVVFRMVRLTLQHGISKESAIAFAMYGYLSCGSFGDIKRGYQFGQMSLVLLDRFGSHDCVARLYQIIYGFIHHWSAHIRQSLEPLLLGYRTGMVFGDIEYALGNARLFCLCSFLCGRNLNVLEDEMNVFCQEMVRYKQQRILAGLAVTRQTVQNLRGESDDPMCLTGDFMNQRQMLNRAHSKNVPSTACFIYMHCLWLAYLFGDYPLAAELAEQSRNVDELCSAGMVVPSHAFFDGLTSLALARKTKQRKWKILADEALKKMTDWAARVPCNFQHKIALLEAEFSFLTEDYDEARMAYDVSITIAGQNGFIQEQALACEKAAIFHFECGDRSKSSHYFDQAHTLYLEWGAIAKVNHLRGVSLALLTSNTS